MGAGDLSSRSKKSLHVIGKGGRIQILGLGERKRKKPEGLVKTTDN